MGGKRLACQDPNLLTGGPRKKPLRLPAVETLAQNPSFLRAIVDNHPSPVFVVDARTREVVMANAAAGEFSEGSSCNALLHGTCVGSPPSNRCMLPSVLERKETETGIHRICDGDSIVTNQVLCVPVLDESGEVSHVIHYFTDISEIVDARAALREFPEGGAQFISDLREEKERAQLYLDIATVVLVSLDSHGRISLLNRKGGELLGCEPKKALGMDWFDNFVPSAERESVREVFARLMAGQIGIAEMHENSIVSLDGREKLIAWHNALLKDPEGKIVGTLSSGEDITERRAAENALRESERRFRELANQLPQTVFEADILGRLIFANTHAFESFGYGREDLQRGIHVYDLLAKQDVPRAQEAVELFLIEGKIPPHREYSARRKDGTTFPVIIYSAPVTKQGQVVGIRGIAVDISERKRLEQELLRREKMESVSRLAGGIAHDFNNMLSPILAGATLSQHIVESCPGIPSAERAELMKLLKDAEHASVKASRLTSRMMNLSRGAPLAKQTASLAELVFETADVVLTGSNIELDFKMPGAPIPSDVDRTQIEQVISNLITNAKYAMPSGGRIHISFSEHVTSQSSATPLKPGRYVKISIADEGTGIPPEVLPKIFEPYFTTKGAEGTGLGLATSFNIVKKHEGHLEVDSELGRGATFHIYLPISDGSSNSAAKSSNSIIPGHGRILVMDDEDYIRHLSSRVLANLGYGCDCARDGAEAARMYFEALDSGSPYSAVILDLTVKAGMGGLDALSLIRELNPDAIVIASSGYAEGSGETKPPEHEFSAILPKPYTISALSKTLHELINGKD